jgi:hypothetical protein
MRCEESGQPRVEPMLPSWRAATDHRRRLWRPRRVDRLGSVRLSSVLAQGQSLSQMLQTMPPRQHQQPAPPLGEPSHGGPTTALATLLPLLMTTATAPPPSAYAAPPPWAQSLVVPALTARPIAAPAAVWEAVSQHCAPQQPSAIVAVPGTMSNTVPGHPPPGSPRYC